MVDDIRKCQLNLTHGISQDERYRRLIQNFHMKRRPRSIGTKRETKSVKIGRGVNIGCMSPIPFNRYEKWHSKLAVENRRISVRRTSGDVAPDEEKAAVDDENKYQLTESLKDIETRSSAEITMRGDERRRRLSISNTWAASLLDTA